VILITGGEESLSHSLASPANPASGPNKFRNEVGELDRNVHSATLRHRINGRAHEGSNEAFLGSRYYNKYAMRGSELLSAENLQPPRLAGGGLEIFV
jgi:hypothetical protein